jgi:hypothetical protein
MTDGNSGRAISSLAGSTERIRNSLHGCALISRL